MKLYAIITAGGLGTRMNNSVPKQFLPLGNKPILMHTISAFLSFNSKIQILLTLPEQSFDDWHQLIEKHQFYANHTLIKGGSTRFHSIKNALPFLSNDSLVAIHDGVRPFISTDFLQNAFTHAQNYHSAIPIMTIKESIRLMQNDYPTHIDRNSVFTVQTPQVFLSSKISSAYQCEFSSHFTDDASVFENSYEKIHTIDGIPENIKITTPTDLIFAEALYQELKNHPSFPHLLCK